MLNKIVFISYSWDDEEHREWVLNLANGLVRNGIDVMLDQYDLSAGNEMTFFMEKAMTADKILLILTPNYKLKADNRKGGVGYEYSLFTNEYYEKEPDKSKIIPILRVGDRDLSCPTYIKTKLFHDMLDNKSFDTKFFELIKIILNKPLVAKPPLGQLPSFDTNTILDVEKSIMDFKSKEKMYHNKIQYLDSAAGIEEYTQVFTKIMNQVYDSLERYKVNFGFLFSIRTVPNSSIIFSTKDFMCTLESRGAISQSAKNAVVVISLFTGSINTMNSEQSQLIDRQSYKFDVDQNLNPQFFLSKSPSVILLPEDIPTIAIRDFMARELDLRVRRLK